MLKVAKAPIQIRFNIQKDTRICITEEKIEIKWVALQLLKIDLKPLNDA